MGDLANMTDCDGRVHGPRLLRWLRSREEIEMDAALKAELLGNREVRLAAMARANLLSSMAGDLERELTPPDYPEDGDQVAALTAAGFRETSPDCPEDDDDTVDMDDPALKGGPEAP